MESILYNQEARIVIGVLVVVLLLYLYHRNSSSAKDGANSSPSAELGQGSGRKSEYTDELNRATLHLDGAQAEVNFTDLSTVEVDDEEYPEITLRHATGKTTELSLGAYDLLVSVGKPTACEVSDKYQVRIWAREKLVYNEFLVDVELDVRYFTGYTCDGSDICIVLGSGLTLCVEEV
jgi:hypothetical protein